MQLAQLHLFFFAIISSGVGGFGNNYTRKFGFASLNTRINSYFVLIAPFRPYFFVSSSTI
jgi:hypothetical protein